jgi:hypothetical protein
MQECQNHNQVQWFDQYRASKTVLFWTCTNRCLSLPSLASPDAGPVDRTEGDLELLSRADPQGSDPDGNEQHPSVEIWRHRMTVRTSQRTVTFGRAFSLNGLDEAQQAGTYTVQTHEESLPGLSFLAWRRSATLIFLPSRPGGAFVEQLVEIDPLELEAAQERDAASA